MKRDDFVDKQAREAREMVKNFSFVEKIKHFWYYYGKYTIAAILALAFVIYSVTQCVMQKYYDLNIAYYSTHSVNQEAVRAFADTLEPLINDITGNGKAEVFMPVSVADITDEKPDEIAQTTVTKITVELAADEYQMYILDENYLEFFNRAYDGIVQSTVLLSDIPQVSKALGFREGEKVYLVMTIEFEQSADNELKAAERENAALVEQYFKDMLQQ